MDTTKEPPRRPRSDWPSDLPSDTFLVAPEGAASLARDPQGFMMNALVRAKWWLPKVGDLVEANTALKISREYLRVANAARYGAPVILDAEEIVRRCEYRVGQLIIEGQEAGVLRSKRSNKGAIITDVLDISGKTGRSTVSALRSIGSQPTTDFEASLELAREGGNLSRASVDRAATGTEFVPSRNEWNRGKRQVDSNKIVKSLADQMDSLPSGLDLVVPEDLDYETKEEAKASIRASIQEIQKEMKKW